MQPYVFPYVGYFQMVNAVDKFVFYNDVSFIKKGWINRNRILLNGKDFLFTIPCEGISQNRRICDTRVAFDAKEQNKLLMTIEQAYRKAPFFEYSYELVRKVFLKKVDYVDELAIESILEVSRLLNIETTFIESKDRYTNEEFKKEDRLIDICLKENSNDYINALGGQEIYTKEYFEKCGVNLQFIKPNLITYPQFGNEFVSGLSIIDVLMFNGHEKISTYLLNFELV